MNFVLRLVSVAFALVIFTFAVRARADRVAVLPFSSSGSTTTSTELARAQAATRDAVTQLHHTNPTESEMTTAHVAVKDGVADTSAEYQAAGRASASKWTVAGHVESHGPTYRLELEACQVDSGRVESLAREIDSPQATSQIAEMLALLLRPEGIGNTEPPWERAPQKTATPAPPPPPPPAPENPAPPPPPPQPPAPEDPKLPYAAGHPWGIGAGINVLFAVKRSDNARGSGTAGGVDASAGYAIASIPGLEIRAGLAVGLVGPQSLRFDAGARYVFPIVKPARVFAGAEVGLGLFGALGGDQAARGLVRGAIPIVWGASEQVQLELVPEIEYAGGGTTPLALAGASARVVIRF